MKGARGMAVLLAAVLVAGLTGPARADPKREIVDDDGPRVEIIGFITAIHARERAFVLRQARRGEDRSWLVRLLPRTRIEFGRHRGYDDDDDDWDKFFGTDGLGPLRVGQVVEVEGRLARGLILAREITIISVGFRGPPFGGIRPPIFPLRPPEIFFPQDGAEVGAAELVVVGRTLPRAHVRVEVLTSVAFFHFLVGSADVTADDQGLFVARILPARVSGGTYRINVRATASGVTLPTASIHVRVR